MFQPNGLEIFFDQSEFNKGVKDDDMFRFSLMLDQVIFDHDFDRCPGYFHEQTGDGQIGQIRKDVILFDVFQVDDIDILFIDEKIAEISVVVKPLSDKQWLVVLIGPADIQQVGRDDLLLA